MAKKKTLTKAEIAKADRLLKDTYKGGKGDVQIKAKDETGIIIAGG